MRQFELIRRISIVALACFGACALLAQTVVPPVTVKVEIVNPRAAKKPVAAAKESVDLSNIVIWLTPLASGAAFWAPARPLRAANRADQ